MNLIEEVKGLGFINGEIKHLEYRYKVKLINNREYEQYANMMKRAEMEESKEDKITLTTNALKFVLKTCLFREEEKLSFFQKILRKMKIKIEPITLQIFDFNMEEYPVILTDKFTRDLFLILTDKDFFQKLVESEVEHIEK